MVPVDGSDARIGAARLPSAPGVYRFRDARGRVLYLGRAVSLRRRVMSYWGDLRDRRHLRPMVARIARVEAAVCESGHEAAWLERNLLRGSVPPWNRSPEGGQETEVWIRLSESARAPGLSVVHVPQRGDFGPYLGGQKARDAVSGLLRVMPLCYAGEGAGATSRDMARLRGVVPADRERLSAALRAVLSQDAAAVAVARTGLERRRDAASTALQFEFAARLQAEMEALDWITARQDVTNADLADFDVHGWADGVLVRFEMRGGRLTAWRQRPCREAAATPLVAATPPEWTAFASRNAALAAHLLG